MDKSIIFPGLHITLDNVGQSVFVFGFEIAFYGIVIAIGMLVGVSFIMREAKRQGLVEDDFLDICMWSIVFGVVGARLYYVVFSWNEYKDDLLSIINIRQGGLAIYGGVIAGIIMVFIMSKIKKVPVGQTYDICINGVIIGQIFGRWGNFFNREVFGGYTDNVFAMLLPVNAIRDRSDITQEMLDNLVSLNGVDYISVHPTFLYESLWNLGVLIIMLLLRKHKRFDGQIFFTYLIGYGIGRFWIEGIRTDQLMLGNTGLPVSQVVAVVMIVIGIAAYGVGFSRKKKAE